MTSKEYNPLFIVGHKRSGSTHLGRVLNMIPEVYVSNETDILWILYQRSINAKYSKHKFDGPVGMNKCLKAYKDLIVKSNTPKEAFTEILLQSMKDGFKFYEPQDKPSLKYIGDQKPFQNIDPKLVDFTLNNFNTPYYIHLIREPKDVIRSCKTFGKNKDGGRMWRGMSEQEILERWVKVEQWILRAKKYHNINIIDIKYEDFVSKPAVTMSRIFSFLNLEEREEIILKASDSINFIKKENPYNVEYNQRVQKILGVYGYI